MFQAGGPFSGRFLKQNNTSPKSQSRYGIALFGIIKILKYNYMKLISITLQSFDITVK
jgi:hypothetical protein